MRETQMLSLDSPRWRKLKTFCPGAERLPVLLDSWRKAVGSKKAAAIWRELVDYFLHQLSITEAAYAVLPHVVAELPRMQPKEQLLLLLDLSFVEAARLLPHAPRLPKDLSAPYLAGVREARVLACACLTAGLPKPRFLYLLCCLSNLCGHPSLGQIVFKMGMGEVDSEEIVESGYVE
jgi:hypothetical protein